MKRNKFLLIAAFAALLVSCGGGKKQGKPDFGDNEYAVRTIQGQNADLQTTYPATIKGVQDVEIRPKVSGFITKLCVKEGQNVKAGQLLFVIDNVTFEAAVRQAKASVSAAKAALATAKLTYENNQKLFKNNVIGAFDLQSSQNNYESAKAQLAQAKAMPKNTEEEKEIRKFYIELAKTQISAVKAYNKYFGSVNEFKELGFETIEQYFNKEDELDEKIEELAKLSHIARKDKDSAEVSRLKAEIKKYSEERKEVRKLSKAEMDKHAQFNRAAKPYVDAKKCLTQQENFSHFDEIAAQYDIAKENVAIAEKAEAEEEAKRMEEEKAELERRKAEKAAKKSAKKNK